MEGPGRVERNLRHWNGSSTGSPVARTRARSVSPWRASHAKADVCQFARSRRAPAIRRWDGITRTTVEWDSLRHDPDLWDPDGDCFVYLHGPSHPYGEPSFRLPFDVIRAAESTPLLERFAVHTRQQHERPSGSASSSDDDGQGHGRRFESPHHVLYIPAPSYCSSKQAHEYHLGTRNFFAWMFCKPIVGPNLGQTLVSLGERMALFRLGQERNITDLLDYLNEQGYSDFRECPDHALGVLLFAEQYQLQELWIDAFAHCVGMNDRLVSSPGFAPISRTTKTLINEAALEMDVRLDYAERQLTNFLDEELSTARLGLGDNARAHLDRFRSFLHAFYVAKFGYWPPQQHDCITRSTFSKLAFRSMYFDFRSLYEYLVDMESTTSIEHNRPADGGICVFQNVMAFDTRNGYVSLDHPLPLLPEVRTPTRGQRSFNVRSLGSSFGRASKLDKKLALMDALTAASNTGNVAAANNALVQAYIEFEQDCCVKQEERVSPCDARKVRWILVYGVLQTLVSATKIPVEVRDTEGVSYNLCCQIPGAASAMPLRPVPGKLKLSTTASTSSSSLLHPNSATSNDMTPTDSPSHHTTSSNLNLDNNNNNNSNEDEDDDNAMELRPDNERAMARMMLSSSSDSNLSVETPRFRRTAAFCEILVYGYGNGLNVAEVDFSSASSSESAASSASLQSRASMASSTSSSPESVISKHVAFADDEEWFGRAGGGVDDLMKGREKEPEGEGGEENVPSETSTVKSLCLQVPSRRPVTTTTTSSSSKEKMTSGKDVRLAKDTTTLAKDAGEANTGIRNAGRTRRVSFSHRDERIYV